MSCAGSWSISQITAYNYYNVVNSQNVTLPSGEQTIWNTNDSWKDGENGSLRPITLHNSFTSCTMYCSITINGTATFPSSWSGGNYVIVGYFQGNLVFQSQFISVPTSGNTVRTQGVYLIRPDFNTRLVSIPFRYGGDFAWCIWLYKDSKFSKRELTSYLISQNANTCQQASICFPMHTLVLSYAGPGHHSLRVPSKQARVLNGQESICHQDIQLSFFACLHLIHRSYHPLWLAMFLSTYSAQLSG